MHLLVDVQPLQTAGSRARAAARYERRLLAALVALRPGWRIEGVQNTRLDPVAPGLLPARVPWRLFTPPSPVVDGDEANERYYADWLTALAPDAVFILNWFERLALLPRFEGPRPPLFGLLHDLVPLVCAQDHLKERATLDQYAQRLRLMLQGDGLVAASPATARHLRRLLTPPLPRVVVLDAADPTCPPHTEAALARPRKAPRARWEDCAEQVCRLLASPVRTRPPRRRPRLAWVSPLPPAPSGIADYSGELLEHLEERYDIDLVVDVGQQPMVSHDLASKHAVLSGTEAAARHHASPYDLFVYHAGNNPMHVYLFELLWRYRGLVVLHDYHLGGLMWLAMEKKLWPAALPEELAYEGAAELAAQLRPGRPLDWALLDQQVPFNRRILNAADAVVVHSAWAWRGVRQRVDVPVARVPLPMAVPAAVDVAEARARLALPAQAFVICSMGWVGPAKRLDSLLRAVALLPEPLRRRTRVAVVGPALPEEEKRLSALAAQLDLAATVHWAGRVPLADLLAYAGAADVCVQLRYPTRGETSAALYRALAAGAACIVSDHGPMSEVPEAVALRVRVGEAEVEDLGAALLHLAETPSVRAQLGRAAREWVTAEHSMSAAVERYCALIALTIERRRARDATWAELAGVAAAGTLSQDDCRGRLAAWARLRALGQSKQRRGVARFEDRSGGQKRAWRNVA